MWSLLSWTCDYNSSDLSAVDNTICGPCTSKSTTALRSTPLISCSKRSCHIASLITASVNEDVVWSVVDHGRNAEHVSLTVFTVV